MVDQVIKAQADVNAQNRSGDTAFTLAVKLDTSSLAQQLVHARANLPLQNVKGQTAYDHAPR
jgi:ankyrin repeat protein